MDQQSNHQTIPTADANPINTTSWHWIIALPLSLFVYAPAALIVLTLFNVTHLVAVVIGIPLLAVLVAWIFGLRNDISAVNRADVTWTPNILHYWALAVLLTPYISATVYILQRYRKIGLKSTLPA
jgi:lipopolysaccharide export LptBFGC system permease protein LptF